MQLKKRKIWTIEGVYNELTGKRNILLNLGENRYMTCNLKDFFQNVATWSIATIGPRGGIKFVNLLNSPETISKRNGGYLIEILAMVEHFIEIKEEVANFKHGSYLLEKDDFIPLRKGKICFKKIESYKNFTIKFNTNGVYGFSIWKGSTCFENRIWSISKCKKAIDEMRGAK